MRVILKAGSIRGIVRPVLTLGIFDGVHRGHQRILESVVKKAKSIKGTSIVITFHPHPLKVLQGHLPLLITLGHRLRLLEDLGIDICWVMEFDRRFSLLSPKSFVEKVIFPRLRPSHIYVGKDFVFGKAGGGDILSLKQICRPYSIEVHGVSPLRIGGRIVSSTLIRSLIKKGALDRARLFLGRPVSIWGRVIRGGGRGRTLGCPTANIHFENEVLPPEGVYITRSLLGKKLYPSLAYLGRRPTFLKEAAVGVHLEVHILDRHFFLYGQHIEVQFLKYSRKDRKFASAEALREEIHHDLQKARRLFARLPPIKSRLHSRDFMGGSLSQHVGG